MPNCWAASLGDCSDKQSREHQISKGLFTSPTVTVQGFPWCMDAPITIGIGAATAKILCKHHNELLSDLDAAAGDAFSILKKAIELSDFRNTLAKSARFKIERFEI